MNTTTLLVAVASVTVVVWLLRVAPITLLPTDRLPPRARAALDLTAPAAMAALVVTTLVGSHGEVAPVGHLLAVVVAAVIARLSGHLGWVVAGAVLTAAGADALGW
jgi:branched-subunit amino acid transport protein